MVKWIPKHYFPNLVYYMKIKFHELEFYKKHWEVIPTVFVPAVPFVFCIFTCIRTPLIGDIRWGPNTKTHAQDLDMLIHPRHRKLLLFNQEYEPNQELYDVLKEMEDAEEEEKQKGGGGSGQKGGCHPC